MPHTIARASATRRRIAAAACCLSLALCAPPASAADLAPFRTGSITRRPVADPAPLQVTVPVRAAAPEVQIGLLQSLVMLLDMLGTGRTDTPPVAYATAEMPAKAESPPTVVPYPGPLAAGTVVINLDHFRVYRILPGGWAELYQERSEDAVFARVGMVR